jgi:hypothetical protein
LSSNFNLNEKTFNRGNCLREILVFLGYLSISLIYIDHGQSITTQVTGEGGDPFAFLWFLNWWPWAISHGQNPFFTHLVWQPLGVSLTWVTSVPVLALLMTPVTYVFGAATSYNILIIISPAIAAYLMYLICLDLTKNLQASIIGGIIFGFSTYEMSQSLATLNLSFIVCIPALLLIVLRRANDRLDKKRAIFFGILLLCAQFYISPEILATTCFFGAISWFFGMLYLVEYRQSLRRIRNDSFIILPVVCMVISPWLLDMYRHRSMVNLPAAWPYFFAADLLNFFIPSKQMLIGGSLFTFVNHTFKGGPQEQDAYMGLPLIALIVWFAIYRRKSGQGRFLLMVFSFIALCSLGPLLWIHGNYTAVRLPWMLFVHLPLLHSALPTRFALFVSLVSAIIAAIWIADTRDNPNNTWKLVLGIVACLSLLPKPHPWISVDHSKFFEPVEMAANLGKNPRVLVMPFGAYGPGSVWQDENQFGFSQTGGYLGFPPASLQDMPIVQQLFGGFISKKFSSEFSDFCKSTDTQYVIASSQTPADIMKKLYDLSWKTQKIDDVTVFTVPYLQANAQ